MIASRFGSRLAGLQELTFGKNFDQSLDVHLDAGSLNALPPECIFERGLLRMREKHVSFQVVPLSLS